MYQPRDETGISDDDVNSIIEDDEENLWLGTYGGGINKFNHITEKFIHYHHNPDDTTSISSDLVRAILKTKNNSIWVGSEGGLSRLIKSDT